MLASYLVMAPALVLLALLVVQVRLLWRAGL